MRVDSGSSCYPVRKKVLIGSVTPTAVVGPVVRFMAWHQAQDDPALYI
jgi:hypothetical protein